MFPYKTVTATLYGGLGNQMFQLAAAVYIAKQTNRTLILDTAANSSPHTTLSYLDTLFQSYKPYLSAPRDGKIVIEEEWRECPATQTHIKLQGYFQNWKYITNEFLSSLVFAPACILKYPDIHQTVFLHIRGGDYVNHPIHGVNLDRYYEKAISMFPTGTRFSVFTNDRAYAESKSFLRSISYSFVEENEIDALFLMSQCAGGICANSSFSWWGAFLNPTRRLVFPNRWTTDPSFDMSGYRFSNSIFLEC
jgi:Glycosyl transferase family 11